MKAAGLDGRGPAHTPPDLPETHAIHHVRDAAPKNSFARTQRSLAIEALAKPNLDELPAFKGHWPRELAFVK